MFRLDLVTVWLAAIPLALLLAADGDSRCSSQSAVWPRSERPDWRRSLPNISVHCLNGRLAVTITLLRA